MPVNKEINTGSKNNTENEDSICSDRETGASLRKGTRVSRK